MRLLNSFIAISFASIACAQVPVLMHAEYFWDIDPGAGAGTPMTAADGNFDRAVEQAVANTTPPGTGMHKLGVRVKGADNVWGPVFSVMMDKIALRDVRVVVAEYFWDTDPGVGNATAMIAFDGNFNAAYEQASATVLAPAVGLHKLGLRAKGVDNVWGPVFSTVVDVIGQRQVRIQAVELFWDADPGAGNGYLMVAFDGNFNNAYEQATASGNPPVAAGLHRLNVRAKGMDNVWGPVFTTVVDVVAIRQVRITTAEYFWDTDPGAGNGSPMIAFDGNFSSAMEQMSATATISTLPTGPHVLHVRAKGTDNVWGPVFRTVVHVDPQPSVTVNLDLRVALQGCMGTAALMNNGLRNVGLVPLTEPYTALGYSLGANASTTTSSAVLNVTFPPGSSVVDWILVEFHPAAAPSQITASVPLLLRRGGTVSTASGTYPFLMQLPAANYYVVVRHRNHLPAATATPIAFTTNGATVAINFTSAASAAYGNNSTVLAGSLFCLWSGDVNRDGQLKYTGPENDRDPILVNVGSTTPNLSVTGYSTNDVNMDGVIKYTGAGNDRDPILINVGGTTPNNVRVTQLP